MGDSVKTPHLIYSSRGGIPRQAFRFFAPSDPQISSQKGPHTPELQVPSQGTITGTL